MDSDQTPPPAPPGEAPRATAPRRWRGLRWLLLWLLGAPVALLAAAVLALWLWAASPGSLGQTLGWAQDWLAERADTLGQLETEGAVGSLHHGGAIGRLRWTFNGLEVQAHGVRLHWNPRLWTDALLGRGVHLQELAIERLEVRDQRAPTPPGEPVQSLALPLPVSLAWSVGRFTYEGATPLALDTLQGRYRYGDAQAGDRTALGERPGVRQTHQLNVDSLQLAQGRYRLQALLGAQAPMPLVLSAQGTVLTELPGGSARLALQATAAATGTLAGRDATLDVTADVRPGPPAAPGATPPAPSSPAPGDTPTLAATARVMPWATQPLQALDATAHRLDLATLWPQAPATALSGTVHAQPDGQAWLARVDLSNANSGPWDQQRLPLQSLQARLEQRGERWLLPELVAQIGRARVQASGTFQPAGAAGPAQWQGELQARNLDPAQLWSTLATTALDATLSARTAAPATAGGAGGPAPAAIDLDARVLSSPGRPANAPPGLRLNEAKLKGRWTPAAPASPGGMGGTGGVFEFSEAVLDAAQARASAQGRVDLTAKAFTGQATLRLPGASGRFDGALAHADGRGDLALRVDEARQLLAWLRGLDTLPVIGPRVAELLAQQPTQRELALSGQARLAARWQGGLAELGHPAPAGGSTGASRPVPLKLEASLDLPQLDAAGDTPWQVRQLHLQASGPLTDLALQLRGEAAQAPWRGVLDTQGRLRHTRATASAPASTLLDLRTLRLQASDASRPDRVVDWTLDSSAPLSLAMQTGAAGLALQAAAGQLQLLPSVRAVAGAPTTASARAAAPIATRPLTLAWDSLSWQAGAFQSKGQLRGLPLSWVDALVTAEGQSSGPITQAGVAGDLLFDGDWDLLLPAKAGTPLRLSARLQRTGGDLSVQTSGNNNNNDASAPTGTNRSAAQRVQAGVREASLSLSAQGRAVQARLRWDSERLGQASASLDTELAANPDTTPGVSALDRWWPASAPLRGTLSAQLPEVGVWSALAPPGWRMRGTLQASATIGGTRAVPQWNGTLQADQLALRSVVDGFSFSNGQLRATLTGDRVTIERFHLQGPRGAEVGGTLDATGVAQWRAVEPGGRRQTFIDLQATATKLRVSTRADRRLTLSGQITAQLAGPLLNIRGRLTADSALFILPDELTPSLGADVVVRGGRNLPPPTADDAQRVQPDVLVDLDLGEQFEVRGRGLQSRLSGQLQVRATPTQPEPRVLGEVRAVNGTYRAYGQRLAIETGVLRFTGPYDNPTLDIVAVRPQARDDSQRVGVQISGSAQTPRVRLISTPELPDSEKLAWLVLGRPASGAGAEAAVLQQAALALLAGNEGGLDSRLASALGLDELSYRGEGTASNGSTTASAVTMGKRLSSQLYLTYERSLAGAMGTVSMFYDLSRRLTLRARAGEENALDLIFTQRFD